MSQVIQETQEEAARGVGVRAGQVGGRESVTGPEEEGAQVIEAEACAWAGQDARQHGFSSLESLGHGVGDALLQLNLGIKETEDRRIKQEQEKDIVVNLTPHYRYHTYTYQMEMLHQYFKLKTK